MKTAFDLKQDKWFIRTPNEATYNLVYEWLKDQGFHFGESPKFKHLGWERGTEEIGSWPYCAENDGGFRIGHVKSKNFHLGLGHKEIKLTFKTVVDSVEYPETVTPEQQQLAQVMQKLDHLKNEAEQLQAIINKGKV